MSETRSPAPDTGDPKDALDTELARFEAEMAELTTTPPPPPPAPLPSPKAAPGKPRLPMPPPPPMGASKAPPANGSLPTRPPPPPPPSVSRPPSQISSPPVPSGARPPPPSFPGAQSGPPRTPPGPPPAGFRPPPPPPAQWSAPPTFPPQPLYGPALPPPSVAPVQAPLPAPSPQPAFYAPGPSGQFAQPGPYPPVPVQYPGPIAAPPLTQGQTLFERDMKALDPAELERVKAALAGEEPKPDPKKETKKRPIARTAAGEKWVDPTLAEWPENDFRLFCGNLGNEVNEDVLSKAFVKYSSFNMAKVIRDKRTGKTRGYGFVSFATQGDMFSALKEMQGKYVGNRPLILRKSSWEERTDAEAQKKKHKKQKSKHVGMHS